MKSSGPTRRLRHLLTAVREYLTHWALAGAILALTGFAPEPWFADLFQHFAIADRLRGTWLAAVDIRIGFVAVGVAIVAWDVLRRSTVQKQGEPLDSRQETLEPVPTLARSGGDQKHFQAHKAATLALPDRPSIAVLPFANMSGDSEQEYFADGMVEEIITALSRMRWLFVIARNSSFTYKGRAVDVKQVGRELGVRYLLEGSVRKSGDRVRITAQLIDATTGAHIWAGRFDGALQDIFDLQDRVTEAVVGAIEPKLHQAEIERAMRQPTASLDAYETYLRGLPRIRNRSNEANDKALALWRKAIELDPEFALAYAMATF